MVLTVKLQQKQAQSLVMTPQLAQSIKLLQLSHGELLEFVKEEIEKNPLLELSSDQADDFRAAELQAGNEQAEAKQAQLTETVMTTTSALDDVAQSQSDSELQNSYDTGTAGAEKQDLNQSHPKLDQLASSTSNAASIDEFDIFTNLSETPSLVSILERQIALPKG